MKRLIAAALLVVAFPPAAAGPTPTERGDLMQALVHSSGRIDAATEQWGYDDPHTWDAFLEYAEISQISGDGSTAFALGAMLLNAARTREPADPVRLARALLLQSKNERLRDVRHARALLDSALDMATLVRTADPELWADIVQQDGNMVRHDDPAAAIECYREAARIREALSPRPRWALAQNLIWLAWNLREQGRLDEASAVLSRVDAMLTAAELDESFERAVADGVIGSIALARGDLPSARTRFARREAVLDSLWDRSPAGFQRKRLTNDGPTALAFVQLLDGRMELAWRTAMRREGRVNSDLQQLASWPRLDPDGFRAVSRLRRARARYPHLLDLAPSADWPTVHEVLRLRTEILELRTDFLARFPPPVATVADIQAHLADDEAYVGWLQYLFGIGHINVDRKAADSMLSSRWFYVIRRDSFHMVEVTRSDSVDDVLSQYWGPQSYGNQLALAASWPTAIAPDPLIEREASRLGRNFFGPAEHLLDGIRHLVVQTSFLTPNVPVEGLRLSDGRWVSDRFTTTYSMSAPAFLLLCDAPARPPAATALLIGDVDSRQLPHAREEIGALARMFENAVTLTAGETAEAELLRVVNGKTRFGVAHLAGHFVTDVFEERSGMALWNGEVLEVDKVLGEWHLDTDLVTLSGCKSIDVRGFNARVLPFVQALLTTGARRVVGNAFDADDEATMRLMVRFYENLVGRRKKAPAGMAPREALREARVWLREYRDDDGRQPYRHPSYWAGFGLIGAP